MRLLTIDATYVYFLYYTPYPYLNIAVILIVLLVKKYVRIIEVSMYLFHILSSLGLFSILVTHINCKCT